MVRENMVQSQVNLYQSLKKWYLMPPCFTQYDKVRIKCKVGQSREWSSTPLHLGVVAIEKGAFESPSTKVANFTYFYISSEG